MSGPGEEAASAEVVFSEPWQAQVFAVAAALRDRGLFTAAEWSERLGREIRAVEDGSPGGDHHLAWLAALEALVVAKGAASREELRARRDAWDRAAHATPHGQPIVLGAERRG